MALLHDLALRLTDEQQKAIAKIDLPIREREVIDFVLLQKKEVFPTALALRKLNMTQTHFEKVCSVLLKKLISFLSSENPLDQVNFINRIKGSSVKLIRHQMKVAEKSLLQSDDLKSLYNLCFEIVTSFPVSDLDNKEMSYYATKSLLSIDINKHPDLVIKIKSRALMAAINIAGGNMSIEDKNVQHSLHRKIAKLTEEAASLKDIRAIYYANKVASFFYLVSDRVQENLKCCEALLILSEKNKHLFSENELIDLTLNYADALMCTDKFKEAFALYKEQLSYSKQRQNVISASYARFFKLAIHQEDFKTALEILDKTFAPLLDHKMLSFRVMAALQFTCYHIANLGFDTAEIYLKKIETDIHRQKMLQYEIQYRYYENALVFLKGNLEGAYELADKNLKFLRSKKFNTSNSDYAHFFVAVKAIFNKVVYGKNFNVKQQEAYDYHFHASWAYMSVILKKMEALKVK